MAKKANPESKPKRKRSTKADDMMRDARRREAMRLRLAGSSYDDIARTLRLTFDGTPARYGRTAAYLDVRHQLDALENEAAEEAALLRRLESQRLDAMLSAVWPKAKDGDLFAVDRMIKIAERRAKLLGLDMPTKVANTDPAGDAAAAVPAGMVLVGGSKEDYIETLKALADA